MSPFKSMWSGDSEAGGPDDLGGEDPVERVRQLRRGIEAAAASIPEEHEDVGRRSVQVAERAETRLGVGEGDRAEARNLAPRLQSLHFELVRLSVEEELDPAPVERAIRDLESGEPGASS